MQHNKTTEDFSIYNGEGTTLRKAQLRLLDMLLEVDRICRKHNIPYWINGGNALGAVRHSGFIPWDDDIDIALLRKDYLKLIKILESELPDRFVLQNRKTERFFHLSYSRVVDKYSYVQYSENKVPVRKMFTYQGLFLDIFYIEKGTHKSNKFLNYLYYRSFKIAVENAETKNMFKKIFAYIIRPLSALSVSIIRLLDPLLPSENLVFGYGITFDEEFRRSEILPVKPVLFEGNVVMGPNDIHAYLKRYFGDYMKTPPPENRLTHAEKIEVY